MEDFQNLKNEFEALKNSLSGRNIDEIGIIELRRIKGDLERLHARNLEVQENLRFDRTIDTADLVSILNDGDKLYDEMANLLRPVSETVKAKATLGMSKVRTRRDLVNARTRNQELINMFTSNLERVKELSKNISDETVKKLYDQNITNLQENINRLSEVDAYYAGLIANLDKEIEILRFGGKVPELENIEEETKGISKEEEEALKKKAEEEKASTEEKPSTKEEDSDELKMQPRSAFGLEDKEEPSNGENTSTEEEPSTKEEDSDELKMQPRSAFGLEDKEEPKEENKEENPSTEENKEEEKSSGEEPKEENPSAEENKDKEEPKDDEEVVDAVVKQPKSTLWQKLQPIIEGVKVFLLTAIAVHTGLGAHALINNNNNIETTTETENDKTTDDEQDKEQKDDQESHDQDDNHELPPSPSPSPDKGDQGQGESSQQEEEKITIELAPGEVAFNAETGVEINNAGNAVVHNQDGTTERLTDRTLEQTDHGTSIVTGSDLENTGAVVVGTLPRTGQEITEEQARANMNTQEEANFNEALGQAFQDFFSNGPTL